VIKMTDYKQVLDEIENREDGIVIVCCESIGFKSEDHPSDVTDIATLIKNHLHSVRRYLP